MRAAQVSPVDALVQIVALVHLANAPIAVDAAKPPAAAPVVDGALIDVAAVGLHSITLLA